jgi:xanthine phosphoribosyltransferase
MELLKQRILKDGEIQDGGILKVGSFLNHQIDIGLMDEIGRAFYELYKNDGVNKIMTIEASGIAIASMTARHFGVPVVFAKKAKSLNLGSQVYTSRVHSFTYDRDYDVTVDKRYLTKADRVLIVDDFMARGKAMAGLLEICRKAGAEVCGVGICIEKGFQGGGDALRAKGVRIESLAVLDRIENGQIVFR